MARKKPKEHAHKISRGHYLYRGYRINCVGYYEPEHRVVWECVDVDESGFGHSFSKRGCMLEIDSVIDGRD